MVVKESTLVRIENSHDEFQNRAVYEATMLASAVVASDQCSRTEEPVLRTDNFRSPSVLKPQFPSFLPGAGPVRFDLVDPVLRDKIVPLPFDPGVKDTKCLYLITQGSDGLIVPWLVYSGSQLTIMSSKLISP